MRKFMVVSDEYQMSAGGSFEPPEYGHDVWEGEAKNRNDARSLAMKEWLAQRDSMALDNRSDGRHPMSGARVIEWMPCERHGKMECEECVYVEAGDSFVALAEQQDELQGKFNEAIEGVAS